MSHQRHNEMEAEREQQDISFGWGESLREARITQGLSIKDVSDQLHFELKLIENIESEAVEKLPPASFVRGYLRNYARLLEIDDAPIVAAYNQVCGEDASVITQLSKIREVSSRDAGPRYATWLVIAIFIISVVVWWRTEVLTPVAVEREQIGTVLEVEPIESNESESVTVPAPMLEEDADSTPVPESAPDSVVEAPKLSTLVLSIDQDSWVEVTDAKGRRLYMDMAKAGQQKTLEGEPPFKLLLGNAPAVRVEYNGEIYDNARHNKKGVARFSLGE